MNNSQYNLKQLTREVREAVRDKQGEIFLKADKGDNHRKKEDAVLQETRLIIGKADPEIEEYVLAHLLGLGEIEPLFKENTIREIMINGPDKVFVDRLGAIELTDIKFDSVKDVENLLQRIVQMSGRRVDFSHPIVNARLHDGSRVNAVIKPSSDYPLITIRKFVQHKFSAEELLKQYYLSKEMLKFFEYVVKGKLNVVICGASGSGKTTFLRTLSTFIPSYERLVVIEDVKELDLDNLHVVTLEASEKASIYELMANALRMRPDRIILSECRTMETFELLQAMGTGHEGSLTTVHSNYGKMELVQRLIRAMLKSGMSDLELKRHIVGAIDLSVFIKKYRDSFRIANISEVMDVNGEPEFKDIYQYDHQLKRHVPKKSLSENLIARMEDNLQGESLPDITPFRRG